MPNKLRINIDFAKLQGAEWVTDRGGELCLLIKPSKSRLKYYKSKKAEYKDSLFGCMEVVPLKDGPNDREDTHFVIESNTKEERESKRYPKLPILGNAREFEQSFYGKPTTTEPRRFTQPVGQPEAPASDFDDDEIPF